MRLHVQFAALTIALLASGEGCALARGQQSIPRTGPAAEGAPVETAPPNVPSFKPAFAGQTRARGIRTRTPIKVVTIASGLNTPWALAFLPDRQMLVTEKPTGRLFVIGVEGKKSPPVAGVPAVDGRSQCGLLDVEVGPDFASSKLIYLSYCEPRTGGNGLTVVRGRFTNGEKPKIEGVEVVFRMQPTLDSTKQSGGRMVFAPDGKLFVVLGDRYIEAGRAQARDHGSDLGKIVRIGPDGSIPKDNPFVNEKGARPEIWTSGHRNILAAALDDRSRLWIVEMGPRGGDELNLIARGKDYGWPTIGYGEDYSGEPLHEKTQAPGMEQPVYYWDPVISPSGLTIYSGSLFPEWKGNFLIGGLSSKALVRLAVKGDRVTGEERLLTEMDARIREVVQGPEGAVYLLTDDSDGKLLKLVPDTAKEK
jgi:glucose/arabinose dehydrogenase